MIIKFFYNSLDNKLAQSDIKIDLDQALSESTYSIEYVRDYWKIDGAYEAKVIASDSDLQYIKDYFALDWIEIGSPIEEYLTSNTMENSGIKSGYLMINILLGGK